MHDACNGGVTSVFYIRDGACNRACGRHSAKKGRDDVCNALRHQLLVGIMAITIRCLRHHLVGDTRTQ